MRATDSIASIIRECGPIQTVRVSSAHTRTRYPYWGAARYEIRLRRDGTPTHLAQERATAPRRSPARARVDADAIARDERRLSHPGLPIGPLSDEHCRDVLETLAREVEED